MMPCTLACTGRTHNGCSGAQADVWTPLREVAEQAWVLWELMVLAQPLLAVAPSPGARR